jgi:transcription elongation factor S-II
MLLDQLKALEKVLSDDQSSENDKIKALESLDHIEEAISISDLEESKIGLAVGALRKAQKEEIAQLARNLLKKWKNMVQEEQQKKRKSTEEDEESSKRVKSDEFYGLYAPDSFKASNDSIIF